MFEEIQTVHKLSRKGKFDTPLTVRLVLFIALVLLFGALVFDDIFFKGVLWYSLVVPFIVGFPFGFYVLSQMNEISWDRKRRIVTVSRIDVFGIIILALYWAIRLFGAKYFLQQFYHNVLTISGATFSLFFGIMVGRLRKVFLTIHSIHEEKIK